MKSRTAICCICSKKVKFIPCHDSQVDIIWPNYTCPECDNDLIKESVVDLDDTNYGVRLEDGFELLSLAGDDNEE